MPRLFADQVVLITGAAAGIGAHLAREFAAQGARLVLTDRRNKERMDDFCRGLGPRALSLLCDVTSEADLRRAVEAALSAFGRIDVVVANAGFAVAGPFAELTVADFRRQFETNVFGVLQTIYAALDPLTRSGGRVAVLGSVAGRISIPTDTPYCMSKGALMGLMDALRVELGERGVSATHIVAGFIRTEIFHNDNEGVWRPQPVNPPQDAVMKWVAVPPEKAAASIVRAIHRREREAVVTGHARLLMAVWRLAPWLVRLCLRHPACHRARPKGAGDPKGQVNQA